MPSKITECLILNKITLISHLLALHTGFDQYTHNYPRTKHFRWHQFKISTQRTLLITINIRKPLDTIPDRLTDKL